MVQRKINENLWSININEIIWSKEKTFPIIVRFVETFGLTLTTN